MKSIFQDETSLRIYEEKPDEGFRLKQFCHLRGDKQRVEEAENRSPAHIFSECTKEKTYQEMERKETYNQ